MGSNKQEPLVTVIIPTHHRPGLLPRAVMSALAGMPSGEVEVLVIPNGGDDSWHQSLTLLDQNPNVHVYPLSEANQNIARNHGLNKAKGELIRFLDDDDYLLPKGAVEQYRMMVDHDLDICSGDIESRDKDDVIFAHLKQPTTDDFIIAAFHHKRLQLPLAHVYRRDTLWSMQWPVDIRRSEDIIFLMRYALGGLRKWGKVSQPVGVWFQHDALRMSFDRPISIANEVTAKELLAAHRILEREGRLNPELSGVMAASLWACINYCFYLRPFYWSAIASLALKIFPGSRPDIRLFKNIWIGHLNPILIFWMILPIRLVKASYRHFRGSIFGWDYRRVI